MLVGVGPLFQQVLSVADAVAVNDCIVLLEGESGTGKELLARRIHALSPRHAGPFIPVNCSAISDSLFESQFYGHRRGAFTGATSDTLGFVRAAETGTLLLDEIGELALSLQPKLLRMLQQREVIPVGSSHPLTVDTRIVASTNCSLTERVRARTFRNDLYHRLNVVRIEIPPLRSRPEDVEVLLDYYLHYYAKQYRMELRHLGPRLRKALREYPWPGNVRELCTYIERLYAINQPPAPPTQYGWDDGHSYPGAIEPDPDRMPMVDHTPVCYTLAQAQAIAIQRALELTGYNRSAAARTLGIHRSTLLRKIRTLGLDEKE